MPFSSAASGSASAVVVQTVGDANATINPTTTHVLLTGALTAPRVFTLPAVSARSPGVSLAFVDMINTLSASNTATLARAGADTVNTGTSLVLSTPGAAPVLYPDGTSKWNLDIRGVSRGGTGATSAVAARTNLDLMRATPSSVMSVVILGDSISNEFLTTDDGKYGSQTWTNVAAVLSGGAMHIRDNAGIPGQVSTTTLANVTTYLGTRYPTHVLLYIGVNDVSTGVATATIVANILGIVDLLKGLQIAPILATICPRASGSSDADMRKLTAVNDNIRNIAQVRGVQLLDLFALSVVPDTGVWKDSANNTLDGLHPNTAGALLLGNGVMEALGLGGKFYQSPNFAETTFDDLNLIANGLFMGSLSNWTLTGGGSFAAVADSRIMGNWGVITATNAAETLTLTNSASITGLTAGNFLCFAGRIWQDITSATALGGVTVKVQFTGATAGLDVFAPIYLARESYPVTSGFSFESVVPAGATSATVSIVVTGIVGTIRVAQLKLQNLTTGLATIGEPITTIGTRGVPAALTLHPITGNAGIGSTASTSTIGASLTLPRHVSSNSVNLGGCVLSYYQQYTNTTTGVTDLRSNNVPGGLMSLSGDYCRFKVGGSFAANVNTKQVWAFLGGSLLFDSGALAFNGGDWSLEIEVIRSGATTQVVQATWVSSNALLPSTVQFRTAAVTLASNATFKVTAQGGATADVTQKIHIAEFYKGFGT